MTYTEQELRRQERIEVEVDGEEHTVYNWVNVAQHHVIRGHNPTSEQFGAEIGAGDSRQTPDAVTPWVAENLWHGLGVEVEKHGIDVIDPTDDEVCVL